MFGKVAFWSLAVALLLGPLPAGSQGARARWLLAGVCFLSAASLTVHRFIKQRGIAADGLYWVFAVLAGIMVLGLVPLPKGLVSAVSPARAGFQEQVEHACHMPTAGWLTISTCTECARDSLVLLLACACIYFVASDYASRAERTVRVLVCMAAIGAAVALLGVGGQIFRGGRLTATFTNANRLAAFLALGTGAAAALALMDVRRRNLWIFCAVASQLGLFLTFSRMGIASAAAGAALTALLMRKEIKRSGTTAAVASATLAILALNAATGLSPALARYSVLFEPGALGGGRLECWRDSVRLFADFPLTGSGAGSFKHAFAAYQDPALSGWYKFAHNDALNVLCDLGPLALAAAAAGVVFWYVRCVRAVRLGDEHLKPLAAGAFFGVTAVLIHSLADYPLRQPAVAVHFFALAGLCSGAVRRKLLPSSRKHWRVWLACGISGLGIVACAWLFVAAVAASQGKHALASRIDPFAAEAPLLAASQVVSDLQAGRTEPDVLPEPETPQARRDLEGKTELPSTSRPAPVWPPRHLATPWELVVRSIRCNPMDARTVYLAGVLQLFAWDILGGDRAVAQASTLAPAWPDAGLKVGAYFLERWVRTGKKNAWLRAQAIQALGLAARTPGGLQSAGQALARWGALEDLWREVLPDTTDTLLFVGKQALSKGDYEGAVQSLEAASERGAALDLDIARALFQGGRLDECVARLGTLDGEAIWGMRGLLLSRPQQGMQVCSRLRDIATGTAKLEAIEGRLLLRLGDPIQATMRLLRVAEELEDADVWADLARAEIAQNMSSRAAEHAARATILEPIRPEYRLLLGQAFEQGGMLSLAEREYDRAWLYDPESFEAARRLARIARTQGDVLRAFMVLEEAAGRSGAPAEAHFQFAVACDELGQHERAVDEARKAADLKPGEDRYSRLLRELEERGPAR